MNQSIKIANPTAECKYFDEALNPSRIAEITIRVDFVFPFFFLER